MNDGRSACHLVDDGDKHLDSGGCMSGKGVGCTMGRAQIKKCHGTEECEAGTIEEVALVCEGKGVALNVPWCCWLYNRRDEGPVRAEYPTIG